MTAELRDLILDLIVESAEPSEDDAARFEAIGRAARDFCRAFPAEASDLADFVAADYASRDQACPASPCPACPPPSGRADEPIVVPF